MGGRATPYRVVARNTALPLVSLAPKSVLTLAFAARRNFPQAILDSRAVDHLPSFLAIA
jgi:hypothetical protein